MVFALYVDGEGYVGEVSAPCRQAAFDFVIRQGYKINTFELREVFACINYKKNEKRRGSLSPSWLQRSRA